MLSVARVAINQQDLADGFTNRYDVHMLVHYEHFDTMPDAISHEKKFRRAAKLALIETNNPQWRDLTSEVQAWRS